MDRYATELISYNNKSLFLTQIGMFVGVIIGIIAIAVIAIMAFERSNDKKSLVNLNNLRDLTLSTLTVNDDLNIKGTTDFLEGGYIKTGLSINQGLSVYGTLNLYDNLISDSGISTTRGLSIGGESNFYNTLNLYDNLISDSGISTTGGLSVSGDSNFYGDTRIEKISTVRLDNLTAGNYFGVSNFATGYDLSLSNSGQTFFVNQRLFNGVPNNIRFNLPQIAGGLSNIRQGLNYKFVWTSGMSAPDGVNFKLYSQTINNFNNLHGLINLDAVGTNNSYNIASGTSPSSVSDARLLFLNGAIYEGSYINCQTNGYDWYINGNIGISPFDTTPIFNSFGNITGTQDGKSVDYQFL